MEFIDLTNAYVGSAPDSFEEQVKKNGERKNHTNQSFIVFKLRLLFIYIYFSLFFLSGFIDTS